VSAGGLRIGLVIERFEPARGGRERSVAEIAAELARRGHRVAVLCMGGAAGDTEVEVVRLGTAGVNRSARLLNFVRAVGDLAGQRGFDVLHATCPVPGADVYQPRGGTVPGVVAAGARRRGPLGRLARRLAMPLNRIRMLAWKLERQLARDAGVMWLAVSEMVAREFARFYGRRENVRVIYGGVRVPQVDPARRASWRSLWRGRWGVEEDCPVLLTLAQNFALKGVGETVEAFAGFVRATSGPVPRLVVVGRDAPGPYVRLAARLDVGGLVFFEEAVDDPFPLYSAADAVVLLSWQDACSRVILEAIRWGVPSLTTQYNGAAELLARGAGRVVASPRDAAAVVAALGDLAEPRKRARMVEACREAADFAALERQVDELEEVYREVARR